MTDDEKKAKSRAGHLRRRFGITTEQYDELLFRQEGCCGVCGKHHTSFSTRLAVDHNHKTGELRGLLCNYCNHRLIGRHTEASLLRKMAEYLEGGTGWFVPTKPKKKRRPRMKAKPKTASKSTG